MFKKLMSVILSTAMFLSLSSVAFAANLDNFNGKIMVVGMSGDITTNTDYEFSLSNVKSDGSEAKVDSTFMSNYKVKVNVEKGKRYVDAKVSKDGSQYKLKLSTKEFAGKNDIDIAIVLEVTEKRGEKRYWESDKYELTLLSDRNSITDEIDNTEYSVNEGERVSIEFDDDLKKCKLDFDDYVYADIKIRNKVNYSFYLERGKDDYDIAWDLSNNTNLTFYKFKVATPFEFETTVGLLANYDEKYAYSIDSNGNLINLNATEKDGYLVFKTSRLGYYVISDIELKSITSNASSTIVDADSIVKNEANSSISKEKLEEVFKEVKSGETAVLLINNDSAVKLSELKAVVQTFPNRALCVVHRENGKTIYQYRITANQLNAITDLDGDDTIKLGMNMGDEVATKTFKKFYSNNFYIIGHENIKSIGVNGYYALNTDNMGIKTDNLKIYWYDSERNYYDPIYTSYVKDKYGYIYLTAPVGYDLIISDGTMIKR